MASTMFHSRVEIRPVLSSEELLPVPSAPQKAVPRTYPGAPQLRESIELQRIPSPKKDAFEFEPLASPLGTPPLDLEMSRPASPEAEDMEDGVEALQSIWDPY